MNGSREHTDLKQFLNGAGVQLLKPGQYMDKGRLDRNGVREASLDKDNFTET